MMRLIHRRMVFPAFESLFKGRNTLRYWNELEQSQWAEPEAIAAMQLRSLRRLLEHAALHSPYYRDEWRRQGLDPRSVSTLADFVCWPLTGRETIRAHRSAMRSTSPCGRLISKATGGSSGVPLQFDLNEDSHERRTAASFRGYGWAGAEPGSRQLYLWGVPLGERSILARWKDRVHQALHRRRVVSCFEGGDALTARFLAELTSYRPDVIVAYVNPLYDIARRLLERDERAPYAPHSIVVGAERLHAFQRDAIERAFSAPVFETYGSREFMLIGAECERHDGLHLTSEYLLVEILDEDGRPAAPGTEGDVVVTDLHNLGMPFIRYVTGDRAIAGFDTCPCGRGLPLLRAVTGRRLDMLQATGGRMIPGEFFPHLVKDFPAVRRFQVIQESADLVRFRLQADGMAGADRARLERVVSESLGSNVRVIFEPVDAIALTPAGKLQVVVNRLAGPSREAA
ncbi:MAG: phenylacetate--CoA ligase family protein [Phycisphaerae bacterium]|nr:phenylacetate--CoA ligase family protein [Phycisphaerae bacterium]